MHRFHLSSAIFGRKAFLIGALVALAQSTLLLIAPMAWASYSCGIGTGGGHCYAEVEWDPAGASGQIHGGHTSLEVVHVSCALSYCKNEQGFVDNEMWISESYPYWLETGYQTYNPDCCTSNNNSVIPVGVSGDVWATKRTTWLSG